LARGAACPHACDAQDTTKQTGAFSLPLFLYTSGREAWQSSCQLRRNLRAIADAALARVLGVMFIVCAPLRSSICALIFEQHILIQCMRPKMQRLFSSPDLPSPKVVNIFTIFSRPQVLRLRYELMCLMNGKNDDGGIHPLDISVPLSCASASHSHSAVLFFFLLRAGPPAPTPAMPKIPLNKRAPSACPYFYILADERRGNRICVEHYCLFNI
jgi:hypothetical protein